MIQLNNILDQLIASEDPKATIETFSPLKALDIKLILRKAKIINDKITQNKIH